MPQRDNGFEGDPRLRYCSECPFLEEQTKNYQERDKLCPAATGFVLNVMFLKYLGKSFGHRAMNGESENPYDHPDLILARDVAEEILANLVDRSEACGDRIQGNGVSNFSLVDLATINTDEMAEWFESFYDEIEPQEYPIDPISSMLEGLGLDAESRRN